MLKELAIAEYEKSVALQQAEERQRRADGAKEAYDYFKKCFPEVTIEPQLYDEKDIHIDGLHLRYSGWTDIECSPRLQLVLCEKCQKVSSFVYDLDTLGWAIAMMNEHDCDGSPVAKLFEPSTEEKIVALIRQLITENAYVGDQYL